jgi:hypothetical protein
MGSASLRKRAAKERLNGKPGQPGSPAGGGAPHGHSPDPFDALLAQHRPFGDSGYLHAQLYLRYQQRLGRIADLLPVAGELASALERATPHRRYRTIGDPVVRHAIHGSIRHAWHAAEAGARQGPSVAGVLPLADCEEVLRETLGHLERGGRGGGPLESGGADLRRLGPEPYHGSIWSEEHRDDVFGRCFRRIVHDNYRGDPLCTPSAADVAMLAKGADLLGALLPLSARSVFSHTHLTVVVPHVGVWKNKGSCSEFRISGTIFLNSEMLRNPWWVAEHLLHESLHQKLYDFRHTHSLLAEDLSPETPPPENAVAIQAIWNLGGTSRANGWDTFRAIAAFHVYVHLALLGVQIDRRKADLVKRFGPTPDGTFPATTGRREAFQRAQYLGRSIKDTCWQEMGPAGRLFVAWLSSTLNAIDPSPPPPRARYLHLALHRYILEGSLVANRDPADSGVAAQLLKLVDDEGETIRRVLHAMGADGRDVERLDEARARRPDEGAGAAFLRFREVVTGLLYALSPNRYGLRAAPSSEPTAPLDDTIRAMVDGSTQKLAAVLEG